MSRPSALEGKFLGAWRRSGACIARPTRRDTGSCATEENAARCVPGRREASKISPQGTGARSLSADQPSSERRDQARAFIDVAEMVLTDSASRHEAQ